MIETHSLTKTYGSKKAVTDVNFIARPGEVTGILGPNGAGKSTTMRLIMGLDTPTSGTATVNGKPLRSHEAPLHEIGALLDAKGVHPGRTAQNHLRALAATHGIGKGRVDEVLEMTGLTEVARKRVGGFSLGMGQRLGIAAALLGDPRTLLLDEPVNGLDPDGVMWVRQLLRHLASEGRTVVLSSHLMSEMSMVADHVVVFGQGSIVADAPITELMNGGSQRVRVVTPTPEHLERAIAAFDVTTESSAPGELTLTGIEAQQVGELCAREQIVIHELTPLTTSLEDVYMALTREHIEYESAGVAA